MHFNGLLWLLIEGTDCRGQGWEQGDTAAPFCLHLYLHLYTHLIQLKIPASLMQLSLLRAPCSSFQLRIPCSTSVKSLLSTHLGAVRALGQLAMLRPHPWVRTLGPRPLGSLSKVIHIVRSGLRTAPNVDLKEIKGAP